MSCSIAIHSNTQSISISIGNHGNSSAKENTEVRMDVTCPGGPITITLLNQQSTSIAEVADSTAIIDSTASTNCTGPSTDSQSPFTSSMDTDTDSAADSAVVTADSGSSSDTDMTLVELRKPKLKRRKRLATGEIMPFDYDESNGPPVQSDDSNLPIQSNDSNPPVVKPVNSSPAASSENSNNSNPAAAAESYPVALDPTGEGLHYETNAVCDKNTPLASEEVSICLKDEVDIPTPLQSPLKVSTHMNILKRSCSSGIVPSSVWYERSEEFICSTPAKKAKY
ncbi:hypothetical protein BT96DRAFT_929676 [Gymnopus androsaceus JB14]|uniref:Uncharacterized protein n=1 Tax=Gymnopus androsaceus JB14 TaxID=1447944 RepID=A0A6A4GDL1_9AGAR|nr:hypothetical protein BT96DRAFT_929676 [Gymnopus androsaceus JB14]